MREIGRGRKKRRLLVRHQGRWAAVSMSDVMISMLMFADWD